MQACMQILHAVPACEHKRRYVCVHTQSAIHGRYAGIGGWRGFPNVAQPGVVERYRVEMEKTGIKICGLGVNIFIEGSEQRVTTMNKLPPCVGCSALDADHTRARQGLCEALAAAELLGASCVFVPSFFASQMKTDADIARTAELFRSVADVAKKHKVTMPLCSTAASSNPQKSSGDAGLGEHIECRKMPCVHWPVW